MVSHLGQEVPVRHELLVVLVPVLLPLVLVLRGGKPAALRAGLHLVGAKQIEGVSLQ